MGQDKNSLAKTPHGFTVGIDSTQRSFREGSRARGSVWHWLRKELKIGLSRIGWVRLFWQFLSFDPERP